MPFVEGKLPVRYLGVPLVATRVKTTDCRVLVEKVENRISDWKNKLLSFAGRCQLINSIISSLHVFWSSVFILPIRIMHDIEAKMRDFLWARGPLKRSRARVSWKDVCRPKTEGAMILTTTKLLKIDGNPRVNLLRGSSKGNDASKPSPSSRHPVRGRQ
ncbi:hypothetical protein QVD17_06687 [Tagetes erecta]|uniref:Reverse transcriptase n=1 Tax=Tagetes erecta TaxID=13708 RepID=A0AAD8LE39_TARER|nr:hypothetical protein QVD17_06687 [Tagetes erecta]